jgi:uncharacterized protein (DUF3820 family)
MSKYIINNEEYLTKNEITLRCREIVNRNFRSVILGDELKFILEVLSFHPNKNKLVDSRAFSVDMDMMNENPCIYIRYENGRLDDISWTKCIEHIPFNEDKKRECKMPFGKYKGISLYDIYDNDKSYLMYLSGAGFLKRGLLVKVNQMLKYGYIPFNPVAIRHEIESNKTPIK